MWAEISFVLSQCTRLTDGQTGCSRQISIARLRMHSQSHGKNESTVKCP